MKEQATRLEISTIQPIPADQRHGTARDLFTVWFGSNLMLLTIVTGGLAVTVYGLPFLPAIWWAPCSWRCTRRRARPWACRR
jgi:NCS1 family nucleobase:cation symporter-1